MMIVAGIDIGSLTAKCAVMENNKLIAFEVERVSPDLSRSAEDVFDKALKKAGVEKDEVSAIVSTGYGRNSVKFASKSITEISCHARGAVYFIPEARTVIDIGGQDSKVIAISEDGSVRDFVMNDKCAAGTGRFLEVMANALNVNLSDLADLSMRAESVVSISSTCTVFAESEVISHLASGKRIEEIVAGIHDAIASRIAAMVRRVGVREKVVLTGGVAKNAGVKVALERKLGVEILVPEEPQIVGAVGAALFAYEKFRKIY